MIDWIKMHNNDNNNNNNDFIPLIHFDADHALRPDAQSGRSLFDGVMALKDAGGNMEDKRHLLNVLSRWRTRHTHHVTHTTSLWNTQEDVSTVRIATDVHHLIRRDTFLTWKHSRVRTWRPPVGERMTFLSPSLRGTSWSGPAAWRTCWK